MLLEHVFYTNTPQMLATRCDQVTFNGDYCAEARAVTRLDGNELTARQTWRELPACFQYASKFSNASKTQKQKTRQLIELAGLFMGAGIGFEPMTFRL
tara:strand:- start:1940 stop:2233 length:294 start_codon:yes stop_codon:yes gene_type:complete